MWKDFEHVEFPLIESVNIENLVQKGTELNIPIKVKNSAEIHYFLSNTKGEITASGIQIVHDDHATITIENDETENLSVGPNTLKIFAASNDVLRPYEFSTSFLVVESDTQLPEAVISDNLVDAQNDDYTILIVIVILIIIGLSVLTAKRKMK